MKLHLPNKLRAAVLTALSALTCFVPTIASGVIGCGAVTVTLALAAAPVYAELSGPDGVTYAEGVVAESGDLSLTPTADTAYTLSVGNERKIDISANGEEKYDVKLAVTSTGGPGAKTAIIGTIQAETLWLQNGRFKMIGASDGIAGSDISGVGTMYVGNGQLWITNALTATDVNFIIGACTFTEGVASLDNAAFRIGADTTLGSVAVAEDARIAFQGGTLNINRLTGSGNLTLKGYTRGTLRVGADTLTGYSGTITVQNNANVSMATTDLSGVSLVLENGGQLMVDDTTNAAQAEFTLKSLSMTGGATVLKGNSAESQKLTIDTLSNSGTNTMSVTSWNGIYNIQTVTGTGTLELLHSGVHWSATSYIFGDATSFSGTLHLNVTSTNDGRGAYESYLELGSSAASALVSLSGNANRWASLALNAGEISLRGLEGTATSYVYSGSAPTEVGSGSNSIGAQLQPSTGTTLLTLDSADNYSFYGTLASGINLVKTGEGGQYIATLTDDANRTISVDAGTLTLGSLGEIRSLYAAAGATVNIAISVSEAKQWGPADDRRQYYVWTIPAEIDESKFSGDGVINYNTIDGKGDRVGNDAICNYFDAEGYTGTDLNVTSGKLALFNPENPSAAADFGSVNHITLNGGALFAASSYFGAGEAVSCAADLVIGAFGGWLVDFGQGMDVTGSVSGTGTLHKTQGGTNTTISGSMEAFRGSLAVDGGGLVLETQATVNTLTMAQNTSLTAKAGINVNTLTMAQNSSLTAEAGINVSSTADLTLNGVTVNFGTGSRLSAGNLYLRSTTTDDTTTPTTLSGVVNANVIRQNTTGTAIFSGEGTHITSTRYVGGDYDGAKSVLTISDGATYDITGGGWSNNQNSAAFLLGHWSFNQAQGTINIEEGGTLNVLRSGISVKDGTGTINIAGGGTLNIKALGCNIAEKVTVNLNGGTIHIGELGIANNSVESPVNACDITLNLNGGTLGILNSTSSWYCGKALVVGDGGVTINTELYDANSAAYTQGAGTIILNAAVTGSGTLTKTGVGTLQAFGLGKVTVEEGYLQAIGENGLTITDSLQFGDKGSLLFERDGKLTTAKSLDSGLKLTLSGLTAGEYAVFQGAASLTERQVSTELLLDRGLNATVSVTDGLVKVTITGTPSSAMDLVWNTAGVSNEWENSNVENWTANGTAERFSSGDNVMFAGTGEEVLVNTAVRAGSMSVSSSGYVFSGNGSITVENGLTVSEDVTIATAGPNSFNAISVAAGKVLSVDATKQGTLTGLLGSENNITWGEGCTLRISGGTLSLDRALSASGLFDLVIDRGAVVTRTGGIGMTNTTTVKEGGTFIINTSGNGQNSMLRGSMRVEGTLRTTGDVFGWTNNGTYFTGLTIAGGTWVMDSGNNTMSKTPITLDKGVIELNMTGNDTSGEETGWDFFSDNDTGNLVKTLADARGQSVIRVAEGGVSALDSFNNKITLRRNATTFQVERATVLSGGTTADLKVDAAIMIASDNSSSPKLIKTGDGILELSVGLLDNTKISTNRSVNTELQAGTLRFSENALMGSGTITMTAGSALELAQNSTNTTAGVTGTGDIHVTGSGSTTLASLDGWTGKLSLASDGSFGVAGGLDISAGRELSLGYTGGKINTGLKLNGGTLSVDCSGVGDVASLLGGELTLSGKSALKLTNYGEVTADTLLQLLTGVGSVSEGVLSADGQGILLSEYFTNGSGLDSGYFEKAKLVLDKNGTLAISFADIVNPEWTWDNSSSTWGDDNNGWEAESGSPDGEDVYFKANTSSSTVTVSDNGVKPNSMTVDGGTYTFSGGPITSDSLTVSGANTQVTLQQENNFGAVNLNGGTLVLENTDAVTDAEVSFNGGAMTYGEGITTDISNQISGDSTGTVKVDTQSNNVTWSNAGNALSKGIEKSGIGTLTVSLPSGTTTTTSQPQVIRGGTLKLSGGGVTLSGSISGSGTLAFGDDSNTSAYNINGDNSGFTGKIVLGGTGGRVNFANAAAAGGTNTTIELAGREFQITQNNATVTAKMVALEGTSTMWNGSQSHASYHLTGSLSGSGTLVLKPNLPLYLEGNVAEFTGELNMGQDTDSIAIVLKGDSAVNASKFSGGGKLIVDRTENTELSSVISCSHGLVQQGSGVLTLTASSENEGVGDMHIKENCEVRLGNETKAGTWSGSSLTGTGTLTLVNGSLTNALEKTPQARTFALSRTADPEPQLVVEAAAGKTVDVGETSGSVLDSITLAAGSQLVNVGGDIIVGGDSATKSLVATVSNDNVGAGKAGSKALIEQTGKLVLTPGEGVTINLDVNAVINVLKNNKTQGTDSWVTLTTGTLTVTDDNYGALPMSGLTDSYGIRVVGAEGGSLILSAHAQGWYIVSDESQDPASVTSYGQLNTYAGVAVEKDKTLSITLPGAPEDDTPLVINNYTGGSGSKLLLENGQADETALVHLNQQALGDIGGNTETLGSISAGEHLELHKTGDGELKVKGSLTVDDTLSLDGGTLDLAGARNTVETLLDTAKTTLVVEKDLSLTGDDSSLSHSTIDGGGTGTLSVSGALELADSAKMDNIALDLQGKCDVADTNNTVTSLTGSGTLSGAGGSVTVSGKKDSAFSGTLDGTGSLTFATPGQSVLLDNVTSAPKSAWNVTNAAHLTIDLTKEDGTHSPLALKNLSLAKDSSLRLLYNSDTAPTDGLLTLTALTVDPTLGADAFTLVSEGVTLVNNGSFTLGQVGTLDLGNGRSEMEISLEGMAFRRVQQAWLTSDGRGNLIVRTQSLDENEYLRTADSHNSIAGAELIWNAESTEGVLDELDRALNHLQTTDKETFNRVLAAAAGSSIATLGSAFSGDMERQLRAIRNRTTTMGVSGDYIYDNMPTCNAWINAEGDYRKVDADGTAAGYTLNSWGGTVGFDVDMTPTFTMGLALTAMYGDLSTDGPDKGEGNLDTYYVSLFARYAAHRWTHTFVGTVGKADVSLDRTVDYGTGSYKTTGNTDGLGFGIMYEVGYVIPVNEDASACIQPIFHVTWRHVGINSYSESGNNAALTVEKQNLNVVTFALGARTQALAGENLYNRSILFEARALLKTDIGDRKGSLDVALQDTRANIQSAELDAFGIELGAGITIPVGVDAGAIFIDASAELRGSYTNVNGTVGYRINF